MEELKASQEKASSKAAELHAKEVEALRAELGSSRSTGQELEKVVSELQQYKEQSEVSAPEDLPRERLCILFPSQSNLKTFSHKYSLMRALPSEMKQT